MSSFLYRLGRAAARARVLVVAVWVVLLVAAGGSALLFNQGTDDAFAIPGSESQDTLDYLKRVFPQVSGTSAQLVLVVPEGEKVDTADNRAAVASAVKRIKRLDQVAAAADPFGKDVSGAVSRDGRAALIAVPLDVDLAGVTAATRSDLEDVAADLAEDAGPGAKVYSGGAAFSNPVPTLSPTEGIGLVVALLVLLLMFRSVIASVMPLLTAVLGVGVSVALIMTATLVVPISSTAPMLAVMLGLAVGIDYALFLLSRHRDQLGEGLDIEESVARATATAGSAVIFAGLTVVIALLGLAVAGIPFLTTMGVAAAVAVVFAVAIAVTLVPALLSFAGDRMRPRKPKRRKNKPPRAKPRIARWWVRTATRVPLLTVLLLVVGLGVCAIPAAELRLALPDNGTEAVGSPARDTYDVVNDHFGPGYNGPLIVTADIIESRDPIGLVDDIADEIRDLPGVESVPLATPNPKGDTGIIQVIPTTAPDSPQTDALVERLREKEQHFLDRYDTKTAVTGITAVGIDVSAQLGKALLPFGILVVGLSLVLLAMVFRSIWVPIKATAGYLLSVGAAFGATSFVFQQGHLADVLNVAHVGSVISFLPIILMGVLFGLAMDYEVFLVSRIREDYVHGGDPHHAIETGFISASRVVVAAAVIMFAVFAAFVPEGSATIKPIAFSLAVGVFVDAFLVRMTLVPAVLALLGHRAWGLPPTLDRALPVFDAEGDSLVHELRLADWPAPGSDEAISARDLRLDDDRGRTVLSAMDIHAQRGQVLVLHGPGPVGKTALLFTLAGRVKNLHGDLKVLGHVLPQHTHAVRGSVALITCRTTPDPTGAARDALANGVELLLVDDADLVLRGDARDTLRRQLAERRTRDGRTATVVLTCQDPDRAHDLLPAGTQLLALRSQPAEVA
ncbi:MMPL family transporter [Stackebrandtia nassauensis]|uniref:MMPL domain protein n=1 Tax=Stackebrandtia nassauensis (strain DSM 44728 / CIP 108903 / NRRL B-16338 / NBRC 102104 / LLR-40K-21) TaxID=446470 RepID=D3PY41_STANL|nr:MMPL family transporter [Stackebrandtia nassauensis]ADD45370.1 MMPL domain protein [Stackebrandtia nassauensis DSM 44728]